MFKLAFTIWLGQCQMLYIIVSLNSARDPTYRACQSCLFFFFLVIVGFKLGAMCLQSRHSTTWAKPPVHFALITLEMWVWTICLGWPVTEIFLISASQVARITEMSHQCPADSPFYRGRNWGLVWWKSHGFKWHSWDLCPFLDYTRAWQTMTSFHASFCK
jgi:hypothetical protein